MLSLNPQSENRWLILNGDSKIGTIWIENGFLKWEIYPSFWGKGYAIEAGLKVRHIALHKHKMNQLLFLAKDDHDACIAEKLGMIRMSGKIYNIDRLEIVDFDPSWSSIYERERHKLSFLPITCHHIGSTAIFGCAAKPIIDILGETDSLDAIDHYNCQMEEIGYIPLGEFNIPRRRFFRKRSKPEVNLHIFQKGDSEITRHLKFRDYLRKHPEAIDEYVALKKGLATRELCQESGIFLTKLIRKCSPSKPSSFE